ncbi:MAG: hypothetical protein PHD67_06780 [Oscillospiraceae bacterium]|nr:hypothetical protein [Oscillospiraceae bacterium]
MKNIDLYSFRCGVMECFNEMLRAGVKCLALSHPFPSQKEREAYLPFAQEVSLRYQTQFCLEDDPLITDLFPASMNRGKCGILFFREDSVREEYLALKKQKNALLAAGEYRGEARLELARRYGALLSYPPERCDVLIAENEEKEP